jgi:hypothetical protein
MDGLSETNTSMRSHNKQVNKYWAAHNNANGIRNADEAYITFVDATIPSS